MSCVEMAIYFAALDDVDRVRKQMKERKMEAGYDYPSKSGFV